MEARLSFVTLRLSPRGPRIGGGYAGYVADPDGFLWEVAWNPKFPHV